MRQWLGRIFGSAFGIGYVPFAPGTFASGAAALLYLYIPTIRELPLLALLIALSIVLGVWAGGAMEKEYGEDPSQAVIDEVAGQWISLFAIPFSPLAVLLAFIFFRLFDVLKPGIVDRAQHLPGGWGIMADDVLAGILANLLLRLVMLALPMLPYGLSL
ncbi:MAG TPA: phosphatidylglycerophosphatase A [Chlorobaculum sp.]|uniref:Phosphatidylglycerophosphatase A n=1 Tax=Chlorobaculum tepidum (strain ATCC 49652 / DSM 12025 / NBRC 103806 / TLS) TaxID=194439 RepID=Q8KFJ0_CHLTE|nr:phosphatidylglycerophosphatase A [Chlorobaculum tepidum]AAM71582.1 phosphatidylglycerophosphatase A [Chlorobaculum tepidum TLS]HBU23809.1 phosphatidylglycerophosphatase A [Chlorobaculum sp.]